jgi:hypothetical protein
LPVAGYFYQSASSLRNSIRLMALEQQLATPRKSAAPSNPCGLRPVIFSAPRSPFSSPVSQNAAALLFDLGTVDVR